MTVFKRSASLHLILIAVALIAIVGAGYYTFSFGMRGRSYSLLAKKAAQFSPPKGCSVFTSRAYPEGEQLPDFPKAGYNLQYSCPAGLVGELADNINAQLKALHYTRVQDTLPNKDQVLEYRYQDATTTIDYQVGSHELANRAKLHGVILSEAQKRAEHNSGININFTAR